MTTYLKTFNLMANKMILKKTTLSRLSLIKYYFEMGYEQSYQSSPSCYFSILTFHDAAELFLILGAETKDAAVRDKMWILDYWNVINQKLGERKLSLNASFKKFNRARNNFKHYGITPSNEEIESFRTTIRNFFDENTPIIFGIEFDEISLIDLVQINVVKEILVEVQNLKKRMKFRKSLIRLAKAYWFLINDFKSKYPYIFSDYIDVDVPKSIERQLLYIYERLGIILLGHDYRKYIKFKVLTQVYVTPSLDSFLGKVDKRIYTKEQVDFCVNFVIDCTLKIQSFIDTYKSVNF
ncbi:hypothetical protein LCGC14_0701810 [marine sediment metagenome]|uniref:Uncharacterized protein n=1 Tax=marine sediment metagenome TaxID=412755 RepID=A0A0F9T3F9_9ZZZZ|nr:hypothetical protein [archaeon]